MSERSYRDGSRAVYRELLSMALSGLGRKDLKAEALVLERAETVALLRRVCAEHGDNDWSDDLHLADVIEKHLERHLPRKTISPAPEVQP